MISLIEALEAVQQKKYGFILTDSCGKPPYILRAHHYIDGKEMRSLFIVKDTMEEIIKALESEIW